MKRVYKLSLLLFLLLCSLGITEYIKYERIENTQQESILKSLAENKNTFFSYPNELAEKNIFIINDSLETIKNIRQEKQNLFNEVITRIAGTKKEMERPTSLKCETSSTSYRSNELYRSRILSILQSEFNSIEASFKEINNESTRLSELFSNFLNEQEINERNRKALKLNADRYLNFQFPKVYNGIEYKIGLILPDKHPLTEEQKNKEVEAIKATRQKINEIMAYDSNFKPLSLNEKDFISEQADIDKDTNLLKEINNSVITLSEKINKSLNDINKIVNMELKKEVVALYLKKPYVIDKSLTGEKLSEEEITKAYLESRRVLYSDCIPD